MTGDVTATSPAADEVLFSEPGARWRSLAYGPVFCLVGYIVDTATGGGLHWVVWLCAALALLALVPVQITAARTHASVELTATALRQGRESIPLRDIREIFDPPPPGRARDDPREPWEAARALGELTGVPRRRTGIGLRLRSGALVQAWAKDHRTLRTALTAAVAEDRARRRRLRDAAAEAAAQEPADVQEEQR